MRHPRFTLQLTAEQLALLSAISHSVALKQQVLRCSPPLPAGLVVLIEEEPWQIQTHLGSGLISHVYQVRHLASGECWAYKRPRGPFAFFAEALRLETEIYRFFAEQQPTCLRVLPVKSAGRDGILKACCQAPTLQTLLYEQTLTQAQMESFQAVLQLAAQWFEQHHVLLDLSPKNVAWNQGWWLLDAGPKIHRSPLEQVLQAASWEGYRAYVKAKLKEGPSRPSVADIHPETVLPALAAHYVFVKDWWQWFPTDPVPELDYFFVTLIDHQPSPELLFTLDVPSGEWKNHPCGDKHWQQHPAVVAGAYRLAPHPPLNPPVGWDWQPWQADQAPLITTELAGETSDIGLGALLKRHHGPQAPLPKPTLEVTPYGHWTELFQPQPGHTLLDLFSHEPFVPTTNPLETLEQQGALFHCAPPLPHPDCLNIELLALPNHQPQRALIFCAGFRAGLSAQATLVEQLLAAGVQGLYLMSWFAVHNTRNQPLVSAGKWETVCLTSTIDYALTALGVTEVILIAASHGALAAWLVARLHPAVRAVILDSAVQHPLDLLVGLSHERGENPDLLWPLLAQHHLPHQPFALPEDLGREIPLLVLRANQDPFAAFCSSFPPHVAATVYQGGHASTMRHDSMIRGIPAECLTAIVSFLDSI